MVSYFLSSENIDIFSMSLTNLDKRDLKVTDYDFSQGFNLKLYEINKNPVDFVFSNYSGFILTDIKNYNDCLNPTNSILAEDYVRSSTISVVTQKGKCQALSSGNIRIDVVDDGIITLKNEIGDYLTLESDSTSASFEELNTGFENQKFFYTRSDDKVLLYEFLPGEDVKRVLALNVDGFSAINLSSDTYARTKNDYTLNYTFDNFKDYNTDLNIDNFNVTYNTSLSSNNSNLSINSIQTIDKNYLLSFPYNESTDGYYESTILGLKNNKTNFGYFTDKLRTYSSISIRDNCLNGDDNIILTYDNYDCGTLTLNQGLNNFYYFPKAARTSIHTSGLIENGAIAGEHPYYSDKIYKNLKQNAYGLSSVFYNNKKTGVYQYTWLSAGEVSNWYDRYRNVTLSGNSSQIYEDQLSTLTLEPGVEYVYNRYSDTINSEYVKLLDSNLKLNVVKYDLNNTERYSEELNRETDETSGDDILVLSGNNFASINKTYSLSSDFSFSFKVYQKDWDDSSGTMIIGDYFNDSGWGLFANTIITPYASLVYNDRVNNYNNGLLNIHTLDYSGVGTIIKTARTINECTWVVSTKDAYLHDLDGMVVDYINLSASSVLSSVRDFHATSNGDYYVAYSNGDIYFYDKITKESELIQGSVFGAICIDSNDTLLFNGLSSVTKVAVDNNDIPYRIESGVLIVDNVIVLSGSSLVNDFTFDGDNNLWVSYNNEIIIYDENRIEKDRIESTSTIGSSLLGRKLSIFKTKSGYRAILRTVATNTNKSYLETFEYVNDSIVKLRGIRDSVQGAVLSDDFTGFDYVNKFESDSSLTLKINFLNKYDLSPNNNLKINKKLNLSVDSGYHHFVLTYKFNTGNVNFYVDSVCVYSVNIKPGVYVLSDVYSTPLIIGTFPNKTQALGKTSEQYNEFNFTGKIKDVRVYDIPLTPIQQRAILRRDYTIPELLWNVPSQKRISIEKIERVFKNRVPGNKSNIFNLNIKGSGLNSDIQAIAENKIKTKLESIVPVNSTLNTINWIN